MAQQQWQPNAMGDTEARGDGRTGSDSRILRIILVEDDPDVRNFLHRVMGRIVPGAALSVVENGAEALAVFEQSGADLIISDHWMPQMSGLEMLRRLRLTSTIPVVMISADITSKSALLEAGASAFLFKPLSIGQLREVVQRFLP